MTNVAVVGIVGIPSKYGGFETLVECLTKYLGNKINFTVYCSSKFFPNKVRKYNNAVLRYIPINANGSQSIVYDIYAIFNAAKNHDIILVLGVSGCIVLPVFKMLYPQKKIIVNIDGLEHKRTKWNRYIQKFLKFSEKLALHYSDEIVADNRAIKEYVQKTYQKSSHLITYGGDHVKKMGLSKEVKSLFNLPNNYAFKVCRIEPENNIEMILLSFSNSQLPLVIVGNWKTSKYGVKLMKRFKNDKNLILLDAIYEQNILNQIRSNSKIYIHGHSAGGTNPSLVEAMSLSLPIFAFDTTYNRETTFNKALYFKNGIELNSLLNNICDEKLLEIGKNMKLIASENYTWEKIAQQYFQLF